MYRIILFTFLLLFMVDSTYAQRFRGELTAGIVGSQVSGDELSGFNKAGVLAGGGVRYSWNDRNSFGFRILYMQKGSRKPSNLSNGDPSFYLMRLHYLEIPFTYRSQLIKKFYAEAGVSVGYLFKSSEKNEDGELGSRIPFHTFDFSAVGMIGYPVTHAIDFRFGLWQSIVPFREHSGNATYRLNFGQYNTAVTFDLIYTFQHSR